MKAPLQALLVAPDEKMRRAILSGKKRITIREGYRAYVPGPVMLCCHLDPWCVRAEVTKVEHCQLVEVTDAVAQEDGFHDLSDLLAGLRFYYPDIGLGSEVTIVHWDLAQGALVERFFGEQE